MRDTMWADNWSKLVETIAMLKEQLGEAHFNELWGKGTQNTHTGFYFIQIVQEFLEK